jgi:hypothetical protein
MQVIPACHSWCQPLKLCRVGYGILCQSRVVHQFKTLIGRSLPAVWTPNAQSAVGKIGSIRPQSVVRKADGPWFHFAVRKIFVAVSTTQDPLSHTFSLGTGRHCVYETEMYSRSHRIHIPATRYKH